MIKLKKIYEANPDGTISKDEDKKLDIVKKKLKKEIAIFNTKVQKLYDETNKIGGTFRSPGYRKQLDDILFGKKGAGSIR